MLPVQLPICVSEIAPALTLCPCRCSRCTGYRPILDAFKVFAKADPLAYTEESIAACKNASREAILPRLGEGSGSSDDEPSSSNGHAQADGGQWGSGHATAGAKKAPGKVREHHSLTDVLVKLGWLGMLAPGWQCVSRGLSKPLAVLDTPCCRSASSGHLPPLPLAAVARSIRFWQRPLSRAA